MSNKVETIDLKGKAYATVPARVKEFRENCPRASIETKPTLLEDGSYMFSATIIKDLSDEFSARATGTALSKSKNADKEKDFEKLETIAVGRALALLGYMASGAIATGEEMEEFNAYQQEKITDTISSLRSVSDLAQLKEVFMGLGNLMANKEIIAVKDEMKEKLTPKKPKKEEGEVDESELPTKL